MPSLESLLNQGAEVQDTPDLSGLPPELRDYILSHPSFAEGDRLSTTPQMQFPYGTWDNPLLQPGEQGAVVGSRPVPGSADRNTFGDEFTPAPYNVPGQADDRAMSIADLLGFGQDQTPYQRSQPQFPENAPYPWDMFSGARGGPPVDYSYPPAQPMVPANEIAAQTGGQTTTYMQPQFQDFSDLARTLSAYRWRAGGHEAQAIPEAYSGDIPPTLLPDFMKLVQGGLPPSVAHAILTQPSYAEGQRPHEEPEYVPTIPYRGGEVDPRTGRQADPVGPYAGDPKPNLPPGVIDPMQGINDRLVNKRLNLPTWEGHTPGDDDSTGYIRLPNGQYVVPGPTPGRSLKYWRNQGNPNSFYWNPAPGTYPVPDYDYGYDKGP